MRAAFGLVALLVAVGVVVFFLGKKGGGLDYQKSVLDAGRQAQEDVRQLGGVARDGSMRMSESITLEPSTSGGRTVGLIVLDVNPAGPAATHFGLKQDDIITAFGPLLVKEQAQTAEDGLAFLADCYSRQQPITVIRAEQTITLPGGAPSAAAGGQTLPPGAQPPSPPAKPRDDRGSLQRQLDNITNAGQPGPGGN